MTFRSATLRLALSGTAAVTALAALGAALPAGASTKTTTVAVTENGGRVSASRTNLPSGRVVFTITNKGKSPAAIALWGHGHKTMTSKKVAPGKKAMWTVTVPKGSYTVAGAGDSKGGAALLVTSTSGGSTSTSSTSGSGGYGY
jgi:hypothetical protein